MVSFTELIECISKNPTRTERLPIWNVREPVRVWRISAPAVPPPAAPPTVATAPPAAPTPAAPLTIRCKIVPYGRAIDPISLGIADPLYNGAPLLTARQMEKEEAIRIEALIPKVYSAEGGRSRGWTKKLLDTHLRVRAAVGGDLFELRKANVGFDWTTLFTSKEMSALFDFLCLVKEIRCIVWKDPLHFGLWPAADPAVVTKEPTLLHISINEAGEARCSRGPELLKTVFAWVDATPDVGWTPPLSCLSILSSKTLIELEKDAIDVGIVLTGKKSEQIVQIAAARRRRSAFSSL